MPAAYSACNANFPGNIELSAKTGKLKIREIKIRRSEMNYIDIHSHILPHLDDGAQNMETTLAMLRIAADEGISDIIVTPHYRSGRFRGDRRQTDKVLAEVRAAMAKEGIHINCIAPAFVATEMTIPWLEDEEFKKMVQGFNPQNHIAEPQEIADVCLFLASRANRFMNGALIHADGGQTAH